VPHDAPARRGSAIVIGIRLIRRIGFAIRSANSAFSRALPLARMVVIQRTVAAGIGIDRRPVEPDRAQLQHTHLVGQQQYLHEQRLDQTRGNWSCRAPRWQSGIAAG
jgi:hypothetical protein